MRIAYFTPLNPQPGGISDHSEELLPHLASLADLDIFIDGSYTPVNPDIRKHFRILQAEDYLRDPRTYDAAVYQLGNNLSFHAYMLPCMRAAPGIIVLQDYCLQYLALGLTLGRGEVGTLTEALRPIYGKATKKLVRNLLLGRQDPGALSFAHPFLAAGRGIIVHSEHALDLVRKSLPDKPVANVPMGVISPPAAQSKQELRSKYGYGATDFIIASVSTRAPKKRLDIVLEALRDARREIPEIRFLVVGGGSPGAKMHRLIREYGLADIVEQTGWVQAEQYHDMIRMADVAIDLRDMAAAETAHSALRCLAAGKPVIVSASGTFLELPDSCAWKIPPDESQGKSLTGMLIKLHQQPERLREMEKAAVRFSKDRLGLDLQAREFIAFVEDVARSTAGAGTVKLLEPEPGQFKPLLALLYKISRASYLLRSYGLSDSLRRFRLNLSSRLNRDQPEAL